MTQNHPELRPFGISFQTQIKHRKYARILWKPCQGFLFHGLWPAKVRKWKGFLGGFSVLIQALKSITAQQ